MRNRRERGGLEDDKQSRKKETKRERKGRREAGGECKGEKEAPREKESIRVTDATGPLVKVQGNEGEKGRL